ncbi:FadR/GntR family transcriptional regulator [Kribbella shirazensis]|uniref:DNA-binding FadR family transcriptional regulator n=1 Tax=Kribbella shirazensis TaxID=1105143 RepID=A0A7X5ZYF8_9ACTN|nr:FCD domain-containing protein [Kribbella shirazensis]NIK54858.1 DNA-binding FadR family transcriptional regulator [Kribbella shirazensis]
MKHGETFRVAQERLRQYIDDDGLRPGDPLPSEAKLAENLGISRISLREATRSLQSLGVIEAISGRGLFVSKFSFRPIIDQLPYGLAVGGASLHEVFVVREALEEGLIEMVAKSLGPADLEDLQALVDEMKRKEEAGESVHEVDKAFHARLYRPLENELVASLIDSFWELFNRLYSSLPGERDPRPARVHQGIVDALRAGEGMYDAMVNHFSYIRHRLEPLASSPTEGTGKSGSPG